MVQNYKLHINHTSKLLQKHFPAAMSQNHNKPDYLGRDPTTALGVIYGQLCSARECFRACAMNTFVISPVSSSLWKGGKIYEAKTFAFHTLFTTFFSSRVRANFSICIHKIATKYLSFSLIKSSLSCGEQFFYVFFRVVTGCMKCGRET